jgi:16S rRNA processing protein RimM
VYHLEHQDLIAMDYQNKEVLIPLNDEIVLGIDREAGSLAVNLPEGLLDIYLSE